MREGGARLGAGANTPVATKIRRVEETIKGEKEGKGKGRYVKQFQPTLRSFMDLRSGVLGPCGQPGVEHLASGNQVEGGRGLHSGPIIKIN